MQALNVVAQGWFRTAAAFLEVLLRLASKGFGVCLVELLQDVTRPRLSRTLLVLAPAFPDLLLVDFREVIEDPTLFPV